MSIESALSYINRNFGRLLLIFITLSLSYCVWVLEAPSRLVSIADDEKIGKTILIHHSAGNIGFSYNWYWGKEPRDSYFSDSRVDPKSKIKPPILYRIIGKYRKVYPGISFEKSTYELYLIKPIKAISDRRLFFPTYIECDEKTGLVDQETGTPIDFVCKGKKY